MNTLSTIIDKNYDKINEATEQALNQIKEKVLDTKSVEPQNASQIFLDYKKTKTELYEELNEDIKHFNENIKPKPISVYNIRTHAELAIRGYRVTGDRDLLDDLSGTLENVKDVKRNMFLLNSDLTRNKEMPWVTGVIGAVAGAGIGYLIGETLGDGGISSYFGALYMGLAGGTIIPLITQIIGTNREIQVQNTLDEADTLDKQLTELKIQDKIKASYE